MSGQFFFLKMTLKCSLLIVVKISEIHKISLTGAPVAPVLPGSPVGGALVVEVVNKVVNDGIRTSGHGTSEVPFVTTDDMLSFACALSATVSLLHL
jgi:hypothetical protein